MPNNDLSAKKISIAVALSGGIDSLAAAYLLKQKGIDLIGIHFRIDKLVTQESDSFLIEKLADFLNIDIKVIDCSAEFKDRVIDYFFKTYQSGKTPNPCLVCNAKIKFDTILSAAKQIGAQALATGHYARTIQSSDGRYHLLKGIDLQKDQSYFLSLLTQEQLSGAVFPLGDYTKDRVRDIVNKKINYSNVKKESQDICFIKGMTYSDFMAHYGFLSSPGVIEDVLGNEIGEHKGLHAFTIGQRRGINCPASEPYYVIRIDTKRNRLIVGFEKDLYSNRCCVRDINWIGTVPTEPVRVYTRIRYRHQGALSTVYPSDGGTAAVLFDEHQAAITPGQGAVFYNGDEVLGGGWID